MMTPTLEQVALHMAGFLDMLDAAFRRNGEPGGLPERIRDAVATTPRHMFVHRFRLGGGGWPRRDRVDEDSLRDNDAELADIYSDAVMIHVDAVGKRLPSTNSQPSYVLRLVELLDLRLGPAPAGLRR
jgi:protein-L-isoaspartate O-methyltransferase